MKDDIEEKQKRFREQSETIHLEPCPHCGGKARFDIEIWGSSGEDRIGIHIVCDNFWCGGQLRPNQEYPGVLEGMAKQWNQRYQK